MKKFEQLFAELKAKVAVQEANSRTVEEFNRGKHFIGKKLVEEAAEVWMASEHESRARAAEEIAQLLYHLQVMMLADGLELDDVYHYL
ncbi:MAG: phosphoribosyl-ATP diphosphatase [Victivallaceae bacterium]|nr:phosphoribosyl-ATP diphosphatase [Victivallaceae bacterium]